MKKWLITILVFLGSFIPILAIGYFLLMLLAGPHGGLLPNYLQPFLLPILWLMVIGIPLWLSVSVYNKMKA